MQVEVRTVRDFDRTYEQRQGPPSTRTYKIEPVSGIGDGAYFQSPIDASPDAGVLFAVKQSGNAYQVLVRNDGVGKARIRDIEQALGTAIAARV